MSDGNDGDNKLPVMDLIDGTIVAEANTPGVASF